MGPPGSPGGHIVRAERGDACTHLGEWFDNSAHRPLGERIVANKPGGKGLRSENSGKESHRRPGVSAIDVSFGRDEFSVGSVNDNQSRVRTLDGHAELLERLDGAEDNPLLRGNS